MVTDLASESSLQVPLPLNASRESPIAVDGDMFFLAYDTHLSSELWTLRENATHAEPMFNPVSTGYWTDAQYLTAVGNSVYFVRGDRLWIATKSESDQWTPRQVESEVSFSIHENLLEGIGNTLFFVAKRFGVSGVDLWVSDGTREGTQMILDLPDERDFDEFDFFIATDNRLYFGVRGSFSGPYELWTSDGSESGTTKLMEYSRRSKEHAVLGDRLLLIQQNYDSGDLVESVWVSEGTAQNSRELFVSPTVGETLSELSTTSSSVFFVHRSDDDWSLKGGTLEFGVSTLMTSTETLVHDLVVVNDQLFYSTGSELFLTDGTVAQTRPVVNDSGETVLAGQKAAFGDELVVYHSDGTFWLTDGTPERTRQANHQGADEEATFVNSVVVDDQLLFKRRESHNTFYTWWLLDKEDNLHEVKTTRASSNPTHLTVSENRLYFYADDGTSGVSFWGSDGTATQTQLVHDPIVGRNVGPLSPDVAAIENGEVVFKSYALDGALEHWVTDGTIDNTRESALGTGAFWERFQVSAADRTFANAVIPGVGLGLIVTDSLGEETLLHDFSVSGGSTANIDDIVALGNGVVYAIDGSNFRSSLWYSDGTIDGTIRLDDEFVLDDSAPISLAATNNRVIFSAASLQPSNGRIQYELWSTDGTVDGSTLLKEINGEQSSHPQQFVTLGGLAYFTAQDENHGLWVSDGTEPGTRLIKNFPFRPLDHMVAIDDVIVFAAADHETGVELWMSDGTTEGTRLVSDIQPGPSSSFPGDLVQLGGHLYFTALNGETGRELYRFTSRELQTVVEDTEEEGVVLQTDLIAFENVSSLASALISTTQAGSLDAWIDFNFDGDWLDEGEQIANNVPVDVGANVLAFDMPANAAPGSTFARFRISENGGDAPGGFADGSEFEDYFVQVRDGAELNPEFDSPDSTLLVEHRDEMLFVGTQSQPFFSVPVDAAGQFITRLRHDDATATIDLGEGWIAPSGGLQVISTGTNGSLRVIGEGTFDISNGAGVSLSGFDRLDLSDVSSTRMIVDAMGLQTLVPDQGEFLLVAEQNDQLAFNDADQWRIGNASIVDGKFLRQLTHPLIAGVINVDIPFVWHNLINGLDVNNSGTVTPGDALEIINEFDRRSRESLGTLLPDPTTLTQFSGRYYDVTQDNRLTPGDALAIIDALSRQARGERARSELAFNPSARTLAVDIAISDWLPEVIGDRAGVADDDRPISDGPSTGETDLVSNAMPITSSPAFDPASQPSDKSALRESADTDGNTQTSDSPDSQPHQTPLARLASW